MILLLYYMLIYLHYKSPSGFAFKVVDIKIISDNIKKNKNCSINQ